MVEPRRAREIAAALIVLCVSLPLEGAGRPRILLTNDDGIQAPGLAALYAALAPLGEVTVAAPAENQSGVGHGITYSEPIFVRALEPLVKAAGPRGPWYRISARPATCVRLALASLLKERPDLVVSGINAGENVGLAIHVSGTVAAAREAAFDGIPAIAVGLAESETMDYAPGALVAARIAAEVLERGLPRGTFLSVNLPSGRILGTRLVSHSAAAGTRTFEERRSPYGRTYYWSLWSPPVDPSPESDIGALASGFATITPLHADANDRSALDLMRGWRSPARSVGEGPAARQAAPR